MFDPTQPHISIPSPHGGFLHRNIRPSYPNNAHKVVTALNALFASPARGPGTSWHLDPTCDAISRLFTLSSATSRAAVAEMATEIVAAAEQLNHHPAVSVAEAKGSDPWVVLVTCATHRPAGLSVRDARLAGEVDRIVGGYVDVDVDVEVEGRDEDDDVFGRQLREWHWRENMKRALPTLDVAEGEEEDEVGGSGRSKGGLHFWRLNTGEDVEAFTKNEKTAIPNEGPVLRGLVL